MVRLAWMLIVMMGVGCAGSGGPSPDGGDQSSSLDGPPAASDDGSPPPTDGTGEPDLPPNASMDVAEGGTPARLNLDRTSHDFGVVGLCASPTTVFTVTNTGEKESGVLAVISGGEFPITADSCDGQRLAGGASCAITVQFMRKAQGGSQGTLSVTAHPGGELQASLTGRAIHGDTLTVTPNSVDFGPVTVGLSGDARSFEVKNVGGMALQFDTATVSTSDFVVTRDGCQGSLGPNTTCQVEVAFRPTTFGAKSAILSVAGPSNCNGAVIVQATLNGTGLTGGGGLSISPTLADFGDYCSSQPAVFVVANVGANPTGALAAHITGGSFDITRNGCNASLAPGSTCAIEVQLRNTSYGMVTGILTVSSASGQGVMAALKGVTPGVAHIFFSSPFIPATVVGRTSAPFEIVVRNPAGAPTAKLTWAFTNVAAAEYTVSQTDCDKPLPGGASCTLNVVFGPTSTGVRYAALVITAEGCPGGSGVVQLPGIGFTP